MPSCEFVDLLPRDDQAALYGRREKLTLVIRGDGNSSTVATEFAMPKGDGPS